MGNYNKLASKGNQPDGSRRGASAPAERVRIARDFLYGGSQSAMAKSVGVTQASISQILAGKRQPGLRILKALAADPRLNESWVLTGEGPPFAAGERIRLVPVTKSVPTGSPIDHPEVFTGVYPTLSRDATEACYWYEIGGQQQNRHLALVLRQGDMLLMDSAVEQYQRVSQLHGRPCAVRLGDGDAAEHCLAVAAVEQRKNSVTIELADGTGRSYHGTWSPPRLLYDRVVSSSDLGKRQPRRIRIPKANPVVPQTTDSEANKAATCEPSPSKGDLLVLAICMKLERRWGGPIDPGA